MMACDVECRVLRDNGFNHLFKDELVSNSAYSTNSTLMHLIIFQAAYLLNANIRAPKPNIG